MTKKKPDGKRKGQTWIFSAASDAYSSCVENSFCYKNLRGGFISPNCLPPFNGLFIISFFFFFFLFFSSHESLWCIFLLWPLSQDFFPSNYSLSILQNGFLLCIPLWPYHQEAMWPWASHAPSRASLFSFVKWKSLVRNFLRFLSALTFSLFCTLFVWKISTLLLKYFFKNYNWHIILY